MWINKLRPDEVNIRQWNDPKQQILGKFESKYEYFLSYIS